MPTILAGQRLTAAMLAMPDWTAMTLQHSWVNNGAGYATAQYRKWPLTNCVYLTGVIKSGTITDGTVIATLPYAPANEQGIVQETWAPNTNSNQTSWLLVVLTSGDIKCYNVPTGTTALSLGGCYSMDA